MSEKIRLSPLAHTWIIDLDGTLVEHNGYKNGRDKWLPGALDFLHSIPAEDQIVFLTAREEAAREMTEKFLADAGIAYRALLFNMSMGDRILLNDAGPDACVFEIDPDL